MNWTAALPLYAAAFSWTMIYDTIYAHQVGTQSQETVINSSHLRQQSAYLPETLNLKFLLSRFQDKKDDLMIGTKSTALRFGSKTPLWLAGFTMSMSANLLLAGVTSGQTWPYYSAVALATAQLFKQVSKFACSLDALDHVEIAVLCPRIYCKYHECLLLRFTHWTPRILKIVLRSF